MMIWIVLLAGLATLLAGRFLLKTWFNHLTIFGLLWSISLVLLEARFLRYYEIRAETWMLIAAGWVAFVLGAMVVVSARQATGNGRTFSSASSDESWTERNLKFIVGMIWVLSLIAFLAVIQHWLVLIEKFGSIPRILVLANVVYQMRVSDDIPGMVPYLDSLILIAILLGGMVTAATGRIKLVSIIPLIIIVLAEMAMMGRARLILAGILFICGYSFCKSRMKTGNEGKTPMWKKALTVVVILAVFASGAELVRSSRGMIETFQGASRSLNTLKGASFITPSIYLYITANHVVFDQYLKDEKERTPFGSNMFAPVYRVLSKAGFETDLPRYQRFYRIPVTVNTGTYLRELHADFGLAGVLLVPFLLSAITTILFLRLQNRFRFTDAVLVGYCYSIVGMSLFYIATRNGGLLTYLLIGLVCGKILDHIFFAEKVPSSPDRSFPAIDKS